MEIWPRTNEIAGPTLIGTAKPSKGYKGKDGGLSKRWDFEGPQKCSCPVPLASGLCHLEEKRLEAASAEFHLEAIIKNPKQTSFFFYRRGVKT